MEENTPGSVFDMHLDYDGGNRLMQTVQWSRFLSVSGMIGIGLIVIAVLLAGPRLINSVDESYPGLDNFIFLFVILFVLLIGTFVALAVMLYRFSVMTRHGIERKDQALFNRGLKGLKIYFLISGVLAILTLLFNVLTLTSLF